jgi:hypothetical protein
MYVHFNVEITLLTFRKRDDHRINTGTLLVTPYIPPPSSKSCSATQPQPVTHLPICSLIDLPMKMEPTETSETSAFSTWTPGRYPKENTLHYLRNLLEFDRQNEVFVITW